MGNPKALVDVVKPLALDGVEFCFKAWELRVKFPSYGQANSFSSKIQAHTELHSEIK